MELLLQAHLKIQKRQMEQQAQRHLLQMRCYYVATAAAWGGEEQMAEFRKLEQTLMDMAEGKYLTQ